jgi:hypothetical protein
MAIVQTIKRIGDTMKQCKVCGTLVHIDSNTCPSCGNHNFFVLDVKICPLCGKVNNITNSFCEQCGKQFVTAQGNNPLSKQPIGRERMVKPVKGYEHDGTLRPAADDDIDRIYRKFLALKPETKDSGDDVEYAYYVEGDPDRLPVVILPKFARASGKNILVNIIVGGAEKASQSLAEEVKPNYIFRQQPQEQESQRQAETAAKKQIGSDTSSGDLERIKPYLKDEAKMFTPFSAIDDTLPPHLREEENEGEIPDVNYIDVEDDAIPVPPLAKRKAAHARGVRVTISSILINLLLILCSAGMLAAFSMVFYDSADWQHRTAGFSPVLYALKDMFKTEINPPFAMDNGYAQFAADFGGGQYAHLAHIVPYLFLGALALVVVNLFITLFTFRQRTWAKVVLIVTSLLSMLCVAAIALAIVLVFNAPTVPTFGIGLLIDAALSFAYFLIVVFGYKPERRDY